MTKQQILEELNELIHDSPVRFPVEAMQGLKDALKYIEERKPEGIYCGEWILTTNELPTPDNSYFGKQYIVCDTIGKVFPLRYIRRTDVHRKTVDRWHYEDGRIYGGASIVAWMEMPKPLKIFEENKDGGQA